MKPNIFMSYSRREVGFVDDLTYRLEKQGFKVWLDYHSLVPGTPWAEQISKGIDEAAAILLIVSKEALASKYVAQEWQRTLNENKRVVLILFETVKLPPELQGREWVDFRGNYGRAVKQLMDLLQKPASDTGPALQTGFKVPAVVWWAFFLSLVTAVMSLFSLWSLFVPFFLLPLPYRIFKRDFNITQVQAALWLLPVVLFLTEVAASNANQDPNNLSPALTMFIFSVPLVPVLVWILRSSAMRRWGKPQASLMKFSSLYKPDEKHPDPVSYFIDYAPQDVRVAQEMDRIFRKYNHPQAGDIYSAQMVFVLLSEFKNSTVADPEKQKVFPIMIQTCQPEERLSRVQWIDFRGGVRHLDAMARLLPHPDKLLTALGVRPTGNQLTLPPIIMSMYYFLILLGIFIVGSALKVAWENLDNVFTVVPQAIVVLTLLGLLLFGMSRALVRRRGWLATFVNFSLALLGIGILSLIQSILPELVLSEDLYKQIGDSFGLAQAYPLFAYVLGVVVLVVFLLLRYRDVRLWFPARQKAKK